MSRGLLALRKPTDTASLVGEAVLAGAAGGARSEFALSVADAWQRRGVATALIADLECRARMRGARHLYGDVLRANAPMKNLARKAGYGCEARSRRAPDRDRQTSRKPRPTCHAASGSPGRCRPRLRCRTISCRPRLEKNLMTDLVRRHAPSAAGKCRTWRTPLLIVGFGCLISMMSFGPRSALGFFLTPMSDANHWAATFSPLRSPCKTCCGASASRSPAHRRPLGTVRVLCAGALMFAAGLALMAHATSAPLLDLSAGALIGFGLSGTSFIVVLATLESSCRRNGARSPSGSARRRLVRAFLDSPLSSC